jgi:phenylacetate-CoA ligase
LRTGTSATLPGMTATRPLRRARGTLTVLRRMPGQRRAHRRPRDVLAARRDARIRDLVRHAVETVPYYRSLNVASIRGAADLERLPLLGKAVVQPDPEAFRSRSRAGDTAMAFRTTGSTALPLTVYHDRASLLANIAYSERERAVEARFVGRRFGYPVLDLRAPVGTVNRVQDFYASSTFRPLRPDRRALSVETPPGDVLAEIERVRPAVIRSYGGYLELLARVATASGGLRHRPRLAMYSGDTLSAGGRELVEEQLGVPVVSQYNAVEAFKIAFTCEERAGFHVHEDLCHVWLAGEDGRPVGPGERGEVVISNLVNRGTVLLNYRLGDLAVLAESPCACGRTSGRLVDLEGRVDEIFELGGGAYVYPTEVWRIFRGRPEIRRYQLVQTAVDRFELRYVSDGFAPDEAVVDVVSALRKLLRGAAVAPKRFTDLPSGPGGKFRHLVPLRRPSRALASDAG